MAMRFYVKPRRKPTIIVVTMIDIFCVLLIFFIVATTFRRSMPAVKIVLPEAKEGVAVSQTEPIILTVTANETIYLGSREVKMSELNAVFSELGKQSPQPLLALSADEKASFGLIIKVMDSAKAAGFSQLPAFIDQEKPPGR